LCSNCLLKHVIEGKTEERIDVMVKRERRRKQLLDDLYGWKKVMEVERGITMSHCMENWLWKRPWTCKADCGMNESEGIICVIA
jgi:hypothetical protein